MSDEIKGTPFNFAEALAVGFAKVGTESLLARTPVGNGTFMSGVIKIVGAGAIGTFAPSTKVMGINVRDAVATGMLTDGVEDIALNVMKMLGLVSNGNSNNQTNAQGVEDAPLVAFGEVVA
jgi:hypothetical protein